MYREDFSGGAWPAGWEVGPFWSVASSVSCATTGGGALFNLSDALQITFCP